NLVRSWKVPATCVSQAQGCAHGSAIGGQKVVLMSTRTRCPPAVTCLRFGPLIANALMVRYSPMTSPGASVTMRSGVDGGIARSTTAGMVVVVVVVTVVVVVVAVVVVGMQMTAPSRRHAPIQVARHRCRPL